MTIVWKIQQAKQLVNSKAISATNSKRYMMCVHSQVFNDFCWVTCFSKPPCWHDCVCGGGVLGSQPRALSMLSRCSTTDPHPSALPPPPLSQKPSWLLILFISSPTSQLLSPAQGYFCELLLVCPNQHRPYFLQTFQVHLTQFLRDSCYPTHMPTVTLSTLPKGWPIELTED